MNQKVSALQEHPLFDNLYGAVRAYEFYFHDKPETPLVPAADMEILGAIGVYSTLNGESGMSDQDTRLHFRITDSLSDGADEHELVNLMESYRQIVSSLESIQIEPCLKRFGALALRHANPLLHKENRPLLGGIASCKNESSRTMGLFISRNLLLYMGATASRLIATRAHDNHPSDELREITDKLPTHSYESQKIRTITRTVIKQIIAERLPEETVLQQELQAGAQVLTFPGPAKKSSLAA